jgi:photosystem II stability/assembly factor-like uncharacterized protein
MTLNSVRYFFEGGVVKSLITTFLIFVLTVCPQSFSSAQWVKSGSGWNKPVLSFTVDGDALLAGAEAGRIFRLRGDDTAWIEMNKGALTGFINSLTVDGGDIFAASSSGVFRSTDRGATWVATRTGFKDTTIFGLFIRDGHLFAATRMKGVFHSTDKGSSWAQVNTGLPDSCSFTSFTGNASILFVGTSSKGVFATTDLGAHWAPANSGLTIKLVRALFLTGPNLFAGTARGLFLSKDHGSSWAIVNNGMINPSVRCFISSGSVLFIGTGSDGVLASTDNGASWTAVNAGLTDYFIHALAVKDGFLYAATEASGVWRRPLSEMFSAASQQRVETVPLPHPPPRHPGVYNCDGPLLVSYENNELRYTSNWTPHNDSGTKSIGYTIERENRMVTLVGIGNRARIHVTENSDGSATLFFEPGKPECEMDSSGVVRDAKTGKEIGFIHGGIIRNKMTDTRTDEACYENVPAFYLLALFYPFDFICGIKPIQQKEK